MHCVKISKEGLIYVCDRGNNRVQVFNGRDPSLGRECTNPAGEPGKCGFVKEQFVSTKTNGLPGSAVSMNFSTDAKQSCLYVGDNSNMTIYVLKRDSLEELGRLGRSGREAGASIPAATSTPPKSIPENASRSSSATATPDAAAPAGRRWAASCPRRKVSEASGRIPG